VLVIGEEPEKLRECAVVNFVHRYLNSSTVFEKPYNSSNCNAGLFSISDTFTVEGAESELAPPISGRDDEKDVVTFLRVIQS
jgi:hypothetical protein